MGIEWHITTVTQSVSQTKKEVNTIKEGISEAWYPCYKEMKKHDIPEFNSFFKSFQGIKIVQIKTTK